MENSRIDINSFIGDIGRIRSQPHRYKVLTSGALSKRWQITTLVLSLLSKIGLYKAPSADELEKRYIILSSRLNFIPTRSIESKNATEAHRISLKIRDLVTHEKGSVDTNVQNFHANVSKAYQQYVRHMRQMQKTANQRAEETEQGCRKYLEKECEHSPLSDVMKKKNRDYYTGFLSKEKKEQADSEFQTDLDRTYGGKESHGEWGCAMVINGQKPSDKADSPQKRQKWVEQCLNAYKADPQLMGLLKISLSQTAAVGFASPLAKGSIQSRIASMDEGFEVNTAYSTQTYNINLETRSFTLSGTYDYIWNYEEKCMSFVRYTWEADVAIQGNTVSISTPKIAIKLYKDIVQPGVAGHDSGQGSEASSDTESAQ